MNNDSRSFLGDLSACGELERRPWAKGIDKWSYLTFARRGDLSFPVPSSAADEGTGAKESHVCFPLFLVRGMMKTVAALRSRRLQRENQ